MRLFLPTALAAATCAVALPAAAATPRELLTQASFGTADKQAALVRIDAAHAGATAALKREPGDREAAMMQATAIGYRAKLTGSRAEAIAARKQFEAIIARDPRNAEAHLALGAWHIGAVYKLGRIVGRAALGAQKAVGYASLDRAIALDGNRAFYLGLAALLRLEMDASDPRGRQLAEAATKAATPTPLDRILQRAATQVLVPLRAGDTRQTQAAASRLLPMGRLDT